MSQFYLWGRECYVGRMQGLTLSIQGYDIMAHNMRNTEYALH